MKISDLKQGDDLYWVTSFEVWRYKYLCVHPTGGGKYHILINALTQEPVRMYESRLQGILNQGHETYDNARMDLAKQLEEHAAFIRNQLTTEAT